MLPKVSRANSVHPPIKRAAVAAKKTSRRRPYLHLSFSSGKSYTFICTVYFSSATWVVFLIHFSVSTDACDPARLVWLRVRPSRREEKRERQSALVAARRTDRVTDWRAEARG